jgi:hypothetical protein
MTIEQTIEIPADYRIFLELPHSAPCGVMANVKIDIPSVSSKGNNSNNIDEIRKLLREEIAKNGTPIKMESGNGWETHIMERYAKP